MELTIAVAITIINCVISVLSFAFNRKDKSNKDTGKDAYAQGRIEEKLANIEKSLSKIENKLDTYDLEIKQIVKEEIKEHIFQYHNN